MLHVTSKWLLSAVFIAASFLSVSSYTSAIGASVATTSVGKESSTWNSTDRNKVKRKMKTKMKTKTKRGGEELMTLPDISDEG